MSQIKRQPPNNKAQSEIYQINENGRKRPGSGQPISSVKSPLPPRKPVFSGSQKQRQLNTTQQVQQQQQEQKLIKSTNNSTHALLSNSSTQQQLPFIKSPQKQTKPPIHIDKKIIILKQDNNTNSSGRPTMTGETQQRNNSTQKVNSAGTNTKQFTWSEHIEQQPLSQRDTSNKRRLVSRDKLKSLPSSQFLQHQQQMITQSQQQQQQQQYQTIKNEQLTKSVPYNQPKCYQDFTMTSGKTDLQKAFASIQMEIKQAALEANQNPVCLNMSEIIEQADDGCSSLAQSTLYQFQK